MTPELSRIMEALFEDEGFTDSMSDDEALDFYEHILGFILEHFVEGESPGVLMSRVLHVRHLVEEGYDWKSAIEVAFSYGKTEDQV